MTKTVKVLDRSFIPFITAEDIQMRVKAIADEIEKNYVGKKPVFLVILNGAFRFAADLATYLDLDSEWEFVTLKSYDGISSTGKVRMAKPLPPNLYERNVIVVEDIIDTGTTMHYFLEKLKVHHPASVSLASFLFKEEALVHPVDIDYLCFNIPNKFVLGYGLDFNGMGRNYNNLWQLSEEE